MRLRVQHTTVYAYDAPIAEAYTELRLKPLDSGGQRCLSFTVETDPGAVVHGYSDRHGNDVRHFDVLSPHARLVVVARSEVRPPRSWPTSRPTSTPLQQHDFLAPSPRAPFTDEVRAFAAACHVAGDPEATMKQVVEAVRARLRYEPGATDVDTDAAEALAHGRGVCQDFAHLALAACRLGGLAGALRQRLRLRARPRLGRGLARLGGRLRRRARLGLGRPHPRHRPDPAPRAGGDGPRLRGRSPDPRASTRATPESSSR